MKYMKELIEFLDKLIDRNGKLVLMTKAYNGNHMFLTEELDGYDRYNDCIELYNYKDNMNLLISNESILSYEDGEFEIALGGNTRLFIYAD